MAIFVQQGGRVIELEQGVMRHDTGPFLLFLCHTRRALGSAQAVASSARGMKKSSPVIGLLFAGSVLCSLRHECKREKRRRLDMWLEEFVWLWGPIVGGVGLWGLWSVVALKAEVKALQHRLARLEGEHPAEGRALRKVA